MTPQNIIAICIAVAVFLAGYWTGDSIQTVSTNKAKAAHEADKAAWGLAVAKAEQEHAESLAKARQQETQWRNAVHISEVENAKLKKQIEYSSRAADNALIKLRDESRAITATLNRLSTNTADPALGFARITANAVEECGIALVEMAKRHDGCEAERRTLIGAWPDAEK